MRVLKNKQYTINNSSIIVEILSIVYECSEYQKVKTIIYHKSTGHILEGPRYYKLDFEKTKYWKLA